MTSFALELLLAARQEAQAQLTEVQRRLVDLNTAIVALEPKPEPDKPDPIYHFQGAAAPVNFGEDEDGNLITEPPYDNGGFLPEGLQEVVNNTGEPEIATSDPEEADRLWRESKAKQEQVEIKVAAEGPVTTAVEHTTLEKPKGKKTAKKGKKGRVDDKDISSPLPERATSPFKNGDDVVIAETGELGKVVSSTPQPGGIVVHGVQFEDRSVKHLGHHKLEAVPAETPVMTAQENAQPAPWEQPAEEPTEIPKPKRRSNGQIAKDYGVSLIDVENWKGGGRITKADIEAFAEQQRTLEEASGDEESQEERDGKDGVPTAPDSSSQATEQAFGTAPARQDEGYYDPASDEVDPEGSDVTYNFDKPW